MSVSYREIEIQGRKVSYSITRKRIKRINMRVKTSSSFAVSCPYYVPECEIDAFIRENIPFLIRSMKKMYEREQEDLLRTTAEDGSVVKLFGKELTLEVIPSARNNIEYDDNCLYVFSIHSEDAEYVRRKLELWKKNTLKDIIFELCMKTEKRMGIKSPDKIMFGNYKSFWGECFPTRGTLKFSYRLIEKPIDVIEYVVIHEYSHFRHPDHSAAFWAEVAKYDPEYNLKRRALKN